MRISAVNGFDERLHQLQIFQSRRLLHAAAGIEPRGRQPLLRQLIKGALGIAGAEPASEPPGQQRLKPKLGVKAQTPVPTVQ